MGKCVTAQYRILEEYKADIQNIVHNVVIYHGAHSNMADQARQMFRDCVYDITELTTCRDCYRFLLSYHSIITTPVPISANDPSVLTITEKANLGPSPS